MFPEYRELITRLKTEGTNHRFLHLFEKHNELDHKIAGMESHDAGGVHAVGLGDDHGAALHAQQAQHGQVFQRLRHGAVVGGHQQQGEVDAAGAGHHGVHQAFVAGHVDEADALRLRGRRGTAVARRHVQKGIAQLDADAALFLFGQAVGVHAGQRAHQRGLAVVDVARCSDNHLPMIMSLSNWKLLALV